MNNNNNQEEVVSHARHLLRLLDDMDGVERRSQHLLTIANYMCRQVEVMPPTVLETFTRRMRTIASQVPRQFYDMLFNDVEFIETYLRSNP